MNEGQAGCRATELQGGTHALVRLFASTGSRHILVSAALICAWLCCAESKAADFTVQPIGYVQVRGDRTTLVLKDQFVPGLLGLDAFSHVWVIWWFNRSDTPEQRAILRVHPRGDRRNPLSGVFATRAPVRPNPIALTLCKVLSVIGNVVEIDGIDAFDGTPILDLKPYIPGRESLPDALTPRRF